MKKVLITFLILVSVSIYSLDIQILEPTKVYIKQSTSSTVIHKLNVGLNVKASTDPSNNEWLRVSFNKGGDSYSGWILASKTDYDHMKHLKSVYENKLNKALNHLSGLYTSGSYLSVVENGKKYIKECEDFLDESVFAEGMYSLMLKAYVEVADECFDKRSYDYFTQYFKEVIDLCIEYSKLPEFKKEKIYKTLNRYLPAIRGLNRNVFNDEQKQNAKLSYIKAEELLERLR